MDFDLFSNNFQESEDQDNSKWKHYAVNHLIFLDKPNACMLKTKKYYILREEVCGSIYDDDDPIEVFVAEEGSVLTESNAEKQPVEKNILSLSLFNLEHFIIETTYEQLCDISYLEASFLVTIKKPIKRLEAIVNRKQLNLAIKAEIGDFIRVDGKICRVNDIGDSNGKTGTYFHVTYEVSEFLVLEKVNYIDAKLIGSTYTNLNFSL